MDPSTLVVLVLFSTVLLRVALVLLVVWLLLPRRRRCPHCGEATDGVVTPAPARWLRLERRWCMACGWAGLAKRPFLVTSRDTAVGVETTIPLLALLAAGLTACEPEDADLSEVFAGEARWVDLTYPFNRHTIFWPTAEGFRLDTVAAGMTPAGYYYAAYNLHLAEHGGTHLDAPIHFAEGRNTTDQIPLSRLIGPAVVVDASAKASQNPDYLVSVSDLEAFEAARLLLEQHGELREAILLGSELRFQDAETGLRLLNGVLRCPELRDDGRELRRENPLLLLRGRDLRLKRRDTRIDCGFLVLDVVTCGGRGEDERKREPDDEERSPSHRLRFAHPPDVPPHQAPPYAVGEHRGRALATQLPPHAEEAQPARGSRRQ